MAQLGWASAIALLWLTQWGASLVATALLAVPGVLALLTLRRNTPRWLDWLAFSTNMLALIAATTLVMLAVTTGRALGHLGELAVFLFVAGLAPALTVAALGGRAQIGSSSDPRS